MGKTTLCDTIMGLVRATSGEIVFDDERIDNHATGEDRQARHLVRAAGSPPVSVADRRRAPDDAGQGHARQALDARSRVRAVPAPRRTASQRRGRIVGRRAADARRRPGVAPQRFAGGDGRAVRRTCAHHRRHLDRGRAPTRGRGSRRARRRTEPARGHAHGRSPAGDGVGADRGRDDRRRTDRQPRAATAVPGRRGRQRAQPSTHNTEMS